MRIEWIAAEGEPTSGTGEEHKVPRLRTTSQSARDRAPLGMTGVGAGATDNPVGAWLPELSWEEERERRIYRGRTINMLRQYMRYSLDTGRLPSVLGREFFRAKVSVRSVVTFEDRVIFVHDMETSLNKLDEFSREIIARHILQEHDYEATARLLHCGRRTVHEICSDRTGLTQRNFA